jgi:hypothetical protein
MDIHAKVTDPALKGALEFIAGEEKKHKAFFEKSGKLEESSAWTLFIGLKHLARNRYLLLLVLSLRLTEFTPVCSKTSGPPGIKPAKRQD